MCREGTRIRREWSESRSRLGVPVANRVSVVPYGNQNTLVPYQAEIIFILKLTPSVLRAKLNFLEDNGSVHTVCDA